MELLWAVEIEFLRSYCDRVFGASKETEQAAAVFFADREETREILAVDGETATIDIRGTLTNTRSLIGSFLGFKYTSYIDIQNAIETIAADDTIKKVRLIIDSPGGNVTGLDETWLALRELSKDREIVAENHGLMASAAYWLATAAGKILATSPSAETGSIGVYLLYVDFTEYDKKQGIKDIRIVSKNAPLKNPDPAKAEGLKAYQDRLDALERVFISRVAEGRGVSTEKVEKDFGRGAVLVAQDPDPAKPSALSVGMIDSVIGTIGAAGGRKDKRKAEENPAGELIVAGFPPFKDYPIVDKPWDATAAIKRVRTKTGNQDKPSESYKNAFFWFDPADKDNFGAYKLPFVDVVDGAFKAVRRGVFAAKGAMAGARETKPKIPASDIPAVNNHIDKYVKKIEKEDKKKTQSANSAINREGFSMKFSDLAAADPDLHAEVESMITAAREDGRKALFELINKVQPALTGDSPQFIKDLAVKVLKGESTEAELTAARSAYDAAVEAQKSTAAAGETKDQGSTPATAPPQESGSQTVDNGEIKSNEDYVAQVKRYRQSQGLEG